MEEEKSWQQKTIKEDVVKLRQLDCFTPKEALEYFDSQEDGSFNGIFSSYYMRKVAAVFRLW